MPAYLVGGFVRDLLLGRPSLDFDVVVEGWAPHLARHLARHLGGKVQVHPRFGTAKWWLPPSFSPAWRQALQQAFPHEPLDLRQLPPFLDLVTARRERYPCPGALPEVEPADLQADLQRRDFTLNAMAFPLHQDPALLIDPFGGLQDLRQGVLRALHARSFYEDPTRIARAARYAARYAFHLHPETARQIPQGLEIVPQVSGDRWRHELDHILDEETADTALHLCARWGLLGALEPHLPQEGAALHRVRLWRPPEPDWGLEDPWKQLPLARVVRYALWLVDLAPGPLHQVDQRLHFPKALREVLRAAAYLWRQRERWQRLSPGPLTLFLERYPLPAVYALFLLEPDTQARRALQRFATHWRHVPPPLTGHDLKTLGLPPGPWYRELLTQARQEAIEGRLTSREQALAWAEQRWQELQSTLPHSSVSRGGDP